MNTKTTGQPSKKPKLLLVLPLIALPFLALIFWAMGGAHSRDDTDIKTAGLNISLPDAHLPDDSAMDKMSFYEQEEKAAGRTSTLNFPDSLLIMSNPPTEFGLDGSATNPYNYNYKNPGLFQGSSGSTSSSSEKEIRYKMQQLQEGLQRAENDSENKNQDNSSYSTEHGGSEALTHMLANSETPDEPDPEMDKLQTMMDRIYDIQHPDDVANRLQQQSEAARGTVFPVNNALPPNTVHLLSANSMPKDSGRVGRYGASTGAFYGLPTKTSQIQTVDKGIAAIVQGNTTVVNGASVKLRLLQDVYINGVAIPAGNFITGQAQLSNDRIIIDINTVLYNQYVFQVKLSVFDTDGMQGLYVPNSINREVLKQSGDNAMQGLGVTSLDPSVGAQAAAAGIETAKTLFSKKLKLTKVYLKTGHKVILKDNQQ